VGESGDLERAALRTLAAGRLADVDALLRGTERERGGDLVALLAETDARARAVMIDVTDVQAVVDRVEHELPPSSRLRFWAHAILAERLLLDLDPAALVVARQALAALDRCDLPVLPSLGLRYARARLRRVESVTWLLAPVAVSVPGSTERHAHRDPGAEAIADLLACGFLDEVHLTRGLTAGAAALMGAEDIVEHYGLLCDARAALGEEVQSVWPSCLDVFVGILAFEVGELDVSMAAFDRIAEAPCAHRRFDAVAAYGRAFLRLVAAGASPPNVAGIERALAGVRRHDPRMAQACYGHVAETLADMASPWCAHFARLEGELPPVSPAHEAGRQVLRLRVAAVGGASVPVDDPIGLLEGLEALGHRRAAARQALRLSHDLARAGATVLAPGVHTWGLDRLPTGRRATLWERWWSRPVGDTSRFPAGSRTPWRSMAGGSRLPALAAPPPRRARPGLELRVMVPAVELVVDGTTAALGATQAKLLLALALGHPTPLHVEQAISLLWLAEPVPTTRNRLASLVHRLRRALGDHGDAVVRTGDLLALDADRWDVDLWRLRMQQSPAAPVPPARSAAPDTATGRRQHLRAIVNVRGNLGDAQFPYDELLVEERHRVCGSWLRHARQAVDAGELQPTDLDEALAALGLGPDDLQPR
jgi:hypothetical protein